MNYTKQANKWGNVWLQTSYVIRTHLAIKVVSVNDITERQLDKIKYEVRELENNDVSFVCEEIEVETTRPVV